MANDYGPIQTYEITWQTGHVERIQAHQVIESSGSALFAPVTDRPVIQFHGEINGRWLLVLKAAVEDIRTVRLVTADEPIPGELAS